MVLNCLDSHFPTLNRVAGFAIGTHLTAVEVRVAVGTLHADVREHQARMALPATHVHVRAAQRILRFVVIKFRNST